MRVTLLILLLFAFAESLLAQKIVMTIPNVTPPEGEPVLAFDWKFRAETSYTSGTGASVGKPTPDNVLIKKLQGVSNSALMLNLLKGTSTNVTFEWFSAESPTTPYYRVELLQTFVSQFYHLSPECPTCINLNFQVGFVPKEVRMYDLKNGKTVTWNISTMIAN